MLATVHNAVNIVLLRASQMLLPRVIDGVPRAWGRGYKRCGMGDQLECGVVPWRKGFFYLLVAGSV
jgi:hypothetical protein